MDDGSYVGALETIHTTLQYDSLCGNVEEIAKDFRTYFVTTQPTYREITMRANSRLGLCSPANVPGRRTTTQTLQNIFLPRITPFIKVGPSQGCSLVWYNVTGNGI